MELDPICSKIVSVARDEHDHDIQATFCVLLLLENDLGSSSLISREIQQTSFKKPQANLLLLIYS